MRSGPCIRGHRSSKCDHRDRVLVEVRKPGRPLSSCPHPIGSCSCERVVINYTIPKSSECACPSERTQPVAAVTGNSRVQKSRRRFTAINAASLEKAIKAGQDAETDASSYTQTPTERSGSVEPSPPSSASSTPRMLPAKRESISSCCQPKPVEQPVQPPPAQQGGCCGSKAKKVPEPVQVKSCCSGSKPQANSTQSSQPHASQHYGQQFQFQLQPQLHMPHYSTMQPPPSTPASFPFGLGAPIYNHAAAAYHQTNSVAMSPITSVQASPHIASRQISQHVPEHNCHCGESCSCFGCAAHPNNATMMEYVRLMAQFQYTGGFGAMPPPLYDMPTYPHHPGYGAEAHPPMSFNSMNSGFSTPTPTQMSFHANMNMVSVPDTPLVSSSAWQQPLPLSPKLSSSNRRVISHTRPSPKPRHVYAPTDPPPRPPPIVPATAPKKKKHPPSHHHRISGTKWFCQDAATQRVHASAGMAASASAVLRMADTTACNSMHRRLAMSTPFRILRLMPEYCILMMTRRIFCLIRRLHNISIRSSWFITCTIGSLHVLDFVVYILFRLYLSRQCGYGNASWFDASARTLHIGRFSCKCRLTSFVMIYTL
jgi:hypothetical protein